MKLVYLVLMLICFNLCISFEKTEVRTIDNKKEKVIWLKSKYQHGEWYYKLPNDQWVELEFRNKDNYKKEISSMISGNTIVIYNLKFDRLQKVGGGSFAIRTIYKANFIKIERFDK